MTDKETFKSLLKLMPTFEELKAGILKEIVKAYEAGLPYYLINSVIDGFQFQLKPLVNDEWRSTIAGDNNTPETIDVESTKAEDVPQ